MRLLILTASFWVLVASKPEMYKEKEDFQYSRSSSDDGTKSGYYGAQRGNMGGNYERAHNMDSLAQHHMSTLVRNVDGELGEGANTRTGSVFSAANSRGLYGSGNYDLGYLKGRNFGEGLSFGDSIAHSSTSNLGYSGYSGYGGLYSAAAANNARYSSSQQSGSQSVGVNSGYQKSGIASQYLQTDAQQAADNINDASSYEHDSQAGNNYRYAQSTNVAQSDYEKGNSASGYDYKTRSSLIHATPVRVYIRPGTRVAIPVAAKVYEASAVQDQNAINSDLDILTTSGQRLNYMPTNNAKHYESSYSYRKQWEKQDTIPEVTEVPTESPFSKNSELYEAALLSQTANNQCESELASANSQSSSANSAHSSGYSANTKTALSSQARLQSQTYNSGASASDAYTNNAYNSGASASNHNSYDAGVGAKFLGSHLSGGTGNSINLDEDIASRPKSYHSSYAYHKSWERRGDPYVIKPVGGDVSKQTSQRLTDASANQGYVCTYCLDQSQERIRRSLNTDEYQQSENLYNGQNDMEQQSLSGWEQDLGQQTDSRWHDLADLGQQTQNKWDDLESFNQQPQSQLGNLEDLGQQTQNQWDKLEDLSQQTQNQWGQSEDSSQQSQSQWNKLEDLSQQPQAQEKLEDLGQQTQSHLDALEDLGQQTRPHGGKLEDFGQQTQSQWGKQEDLGQQIQSHWSKIEDLGQQTQTQDKLEDLGQQNQNQWDQLEGLSQQSQTQDKLEELGQQTQSLWGKLEDLGQQTQSHWGKPEDLGQQIQSQKSKIEDLGQQTQTQDKLEDLGQQNQNQWDQLENLSQQSQSQWNILEGLSQQPHAQEKLEDLSQQTHSHWDALEDLSQQTRPHGGKLEDLGQQTQNQWGLLEDLSQQSQTQDKLEDLGQQTQSPWDKLQDLSQKLQSKWDSSANAGQQTQNKWKNLNHPDPRENLGYQGQPQNVANFGEETQLTENTYGGYQFYNPWTMDRRFVPYTYYRDIPELPYYAQESQENINNRWNCHNYEHGSYFHHHNFDFKAATHDSDFSFNSNPIDHSGIPKENSAQNSKDKLLPKSDTNVQRETTTINSVITDDKTSDSRNKDEAQKNNSTNVTRHPIDIGRGDIGPEDTSSETTNIDSKNSYKTPEEIESLSLIKDQRNILVEPLKLSVTGLNQQSEPDNKQKLWKELSTVIESVTTSTSKPTQNIGNYNMNVTPKSNFHSSSNNPVFNGKKKESKQNYQPEHEKPIEVLDNFEQQNWGQQTQSFDQHYIGQHYIGQHLEPFEEQNKAQHLEPVEEQSLEQKLVSSEEQNLEQHLEPFEEKYTAQHLEPFEELNVAQHLEPFEGQIMGHLEPLAEEHIAQLNKFELQNWGQQTKSFDQQNMEHLEPFEQENLGQKLEPSGKYNMEQIETIDKNIELHNSEQNARTLDILEKQTVEQYSHNKFGQQLKLPTDENIVQNLQASSKHIQEQNNKLSQNHDLLIPIEPTTEKPGFWGSVWSKTKKAKNSVVSWFNS